MDNVTLLPVYSTVERQLPPEMVPKIPCNMQVVRLWSGPRPISFIVSKFGALIQREQGQWFWNNHAKADLVEDPDLPPMLILPYGTRIVGYRQNKFFILKDGAIPRLFYEHQSEETVNENRVQPSFDGRILFEDKTGILKLCPALIRRSRGKIRNATKKLSDHDLEEAAQMCPHRPIEFFSLHDGGICSRIGSEVYMNRNKKPVWRREGPWPGRGRWRPFAAALLTLDPVPVLPGQSPSCKGVMKYRSDTKFQVEDIELPDDFDCFSGMFETGPRSTLVLIGSDQRFYIGKRVAVTSKLRKTELRENVLFTDLFGSCADMYRHPWGILFHLVRGDMHELLVLVLKK